MSREGRSQPIQPFAAHGFLGNTPANGVLPGRILVVEPEDRVRQGRRRPALDPVVGQHGFLGNTPANGVLPRPISVVPLIDERRRQLPPLPPVAISGAFTALAPPSVAPPAPSIVPLFDERRRLLPSLSPPATHGFVDSGVGVPGTTPPPPTNVDRADHRARFLPLPALAISGALQAVTGQLPATPPAPYIVPIEERRRLLAAAPPDIAVGFDDATPPAANVVEPDDRKRRRGLPPDPIGISAALAASAQPPTVLPTGPFVVPLTERNRLLERLPTLTISHGFVDPGPGPVGTTPPPASSIDRVDQRVRYLPPPSLVLSGVLAPFIPPPPVTVLAGTDWAAAISSW